MHFDAEGFQNSMEQEFDIFRDLLNLSTSDAHLHRLYALRQEFARLSLQVILPASDFAKESLCPATLIEELILNQLLAQWCRVLRDIALPIWAISHWNYPYPDRDQQASLANYSGKKRQQVADWFTNWRARVWMRWSGSAAKNQD